MSEPVSIGTLVGGARPVLRIPKVCPAPPKGCGAEYEGNSLTPLKPGESRRVWPCEVCIAKWEIWAKQVGQAVTVKKPVTELKRPQRTFSDEDDRFGS